FAAHAGVAPRSAVADLVLIKRRKGFAVQEFVLIFLANAACIFVLIAVRSFGRLVGRPMQSSAADLPARSTTTRTCRPWRGKGNVINLTRSSRSRWSGRARWISAGC